MIKKLVQRYAHFSKELIPDFRKTLPIFRFYQNMLLVFMQSCDIRSVFCPSVP